MAEKNPLLHSLEDISEPPLLLGFEVAPIWYIVATLLLIVIAVIAYYALKRWRFYRAKREALNILGQITIDNDAPAAINTLLKQVLQHYQPKHPALSFNTLAWQSWLTNSDSSLKAAKMLPDLTTLLYQAEKDSAQTQAFLNFAKSWVKHYKGKDGANSLNKEPANA